MSALFEPAERCCRIRSRHVNERKIHPILIQGIVENKIDANRNVLQKLNCSRATRVEIEKSQLLSEVSL